MIHYTGNRTDSAINNGYYFRSNKNVGASANYFVDEKEVVVSVPAGFIPYSVGRNYGKNNLFGTVTNKNSINIEMCSTKGEIAHDTFENTVTLTKALMSKYNIKPSNVVRHYDVCSKQCPGWNGWLPSTSLGNKYWNQFKARITPVTSNPLCYPKYKGNSSKIDEVFKAIGVPEKYRGNVVKRRPIAKKNGYANYIGLGSQNLNLITIAKEGRLKKV